MAAGRCRSQATSAGFGPAWPAACASLPVVVVLPEPCRPHIRITVGGLRRERRASRRAVPEQRGRAPRRRSSRPAGPASGSSSTSAPTARSRTVATNVLDDAEVDVRLEQREADLAHGARRCRPRSARPRPRRSPRVACSRSERESNMRSTRKVGRRTLARRLAAGRSMTLGVMTMAHAAVGAALARGSARRRTAALASRRRSHALLDLPAPRRPRRGRARACSSLATIALTGAALRHAQPRVLVRVRVLGCPTSSTSSAAGRRAPLPHAPLLVAARLAARAAAWAHGAQATVAVRLAARARTRSRRAARVSETRNRWRASC